jgi:hemoglobin
MALYDDFGGDAVMQPLLQDFYRRIDRSAIRALFPPDLHETAEKQFAFQSEFWGGPARYSAWRGHPRLRARHLPFAIDAAAAGEWLRCMREAVEASAMPPEHRPRFLRQMELTAAAMVNRGAAGSDPW